MGQYYQPTIIKDRKVKGRLDIRAYFYSHEYDCGLKLMEHSYKGNPLVCAVRNWLIAHEGGRVVWAGDYADGEEKGKANLYAYPTDRGMRSTHASTEYLPEYHFYNNHDKHEFVDLDKCQSADEYGCIVEPLPILTCEGNGRGGGDYEGTGMALVGTWARDFITVDTAPADGYTELDVDFKEQF